MKTYKIKRRSYGMSRVEVKVYTNLLDWYELKHICTHSPDGFEFGYAGSGPADLALSILVDVYGDIRQVGTPRYQQFKEDIISTKKDWYWEITEEEIRMWDKLSRIGE